VCARCGKRERRREERLRSFCSYCFVYFSQGFTRIISKGEELISRALYIHEERETRRDDVFFFAFVFLFGKRRMDGLARTTTASVVASIRVVEQRCFFVFFVEDGDKNGRCAFSSKTPRRERRCKNDERLEEEEKRRKGLSRDDDRRRRVLRQRTTPERD
jgi:hypothetical protein